MGFSAQIQQPQTGGGGKVSPFGSAAQRGTQQFTQQDVPQTNDYQSDQMQQTQQIQPRTNVAGTMDAQAQQAFNALRASQGQLGQSSQQGISNNTGRTTQPMGKGGAQTNSATSGQPRMGAPNQYSNTVGQWDNTQQQRPMAGGGKGKG